MNEDQEIKKLQQIKWRTYRSKQIDRFSIIINDDSVFEKYFGERYVESLSIKSKELTSKIVKLAVIYAIFMFSLFFSQHLGNTTFKMFGYGFKNIGRYKEFLLFLASIIPPISATLNAYQKYINALTKECLKKIAPDATVRKFYAHMFLDEYFEWLPGRDPSHATRSHGVVALLMMAMALVLIFLFITLLAGSFFVQIYVIYDVIINPVASKYINLFVVTFAISSLLFSWLLGILQLPMPEVDISNISKLTRIEEEDPARYQEIMKNLSIEKAKKDEIVRVILSFSIYIATFTFISIYFFSDSLDDISFFLGNGMIGAFLIMFFFQRNITIR